MSVHGWGGPIATAIGGAVIAGAAQLGVGYGLGVIGWHGDGAGWAAALAWTMWVGALAVIVGALAGQRSLERTTAADAAPIGTGGLDRALWRATLAIAATLGALVVVPMTALPARSVVTEATFAPAFVVGWYAVAGVLIGLVLAILVLSSRAFATNVIATGVWWWLIAIVATSDAAVAGRGLVSAQLAAWRFTGGETGTIAGSVTALELPGQVWWDSVYLPGALLLLGAALMIGILTAVSATRRGHGWIGVALSGGAGPALLTTVFLLAGPRLTNAPSEQISALLVSPYGVLAGLIGSVAVTLAIDHAARPKVQLEAA